MTRMAVDRKKNKLKCLSYNIHTLTALYTQYIYKSLNPLSPNIHKQIILQTDLHTSPLRI